MQIKVFAMYPMEFVDNEKVFNKNTLVIGISQAGRSTSTIKALDKAKALGLMTLAITANIQAPVTEHADRTVLLAVGEELAGPKTKGYEGSVATLALLGMKLAEKQERSQEKEKKNLQEQW